MVYPLTVTHPGINQARCKAFTLIKPKCANTN